MMKTATTGSVVAVTGAAGHLGNVLVRELVAAGQRVRAVLQPGESERPLAGVEVETVRADVRDYPSLEQALGDADVVFHLAGIVTILPGRRRLLAAVNVQGTANVCRACVAAGVRRLVYTSSVHALPEPPHGVPVRETGDINPGAVLGAYGWSKACATIEVQKCAASGLDAVTVFPTGIIGPFDFRPSEMGQLVLDFCTQRIPARVDGAYDFVDVRDVARGLVLAARRGRCGQGYLLSGSRITVAELFFELERLTGVKAPQRRVPLWLAQTAGFFAPLVAAFRRRRPLFTSYSLKVLCSNSEMDSTKARQELGFSSRPIRETLADTVRWFVQAGRLKLAVSV